MVQIVTADEAAVDEEELFAARALGMFGLAGEAHHAHELRAFLHRHQALIVLASEQVRDALAQARVASSSRLVGSVAIGGVSRKLMDFQVVVNECEGQVGMGEGHALEFINDVLQFHRIALQELSSRRYIEEQTAHADSAAHLPRDRFLRLDATAFNEDACAEFILWPPRLQLHMCNGRNARQRFAPEAFGAQREEVIGRTDLAGGVPLEAEARIGWAHTHAVVDHLHERSPGILHNERDRAGPGIHTVLQQFLHHACGPRNHFARRDLVGHMVGQQAYDVGHGSGSADESRSGEALSPAALPVAAIRCTTHTA